jgi:hypothetical protein
MNAVYDNYIIFFRRLALVLCGLYVLNWVFTPIIYGSYDLEVRLRPKGNEKFDSATWKRPIVGSATYRYAMVDDLMRNYLRTQMTEDAVLTLLGKPERIIRSDTQNVIYTYVINGKEIPPSGGWLFYRRFPSLEPWVLTVEIENDLVKKFGVTTT